MTASAESTPLAGMPALDACWQRIGVQGDRSCERLVQHVHCHNCERHAEAAVLLLDPMCSISAQPRAHRLLLVATTINSVAPRYQP